MNNECYFERRVELVLTEQTSNSNLNKIEIENKVLTGKRLTRSEGLALINCSDLTWLGYLADIKRKQFTKDQVFFNVNRHINLTNICLSRCEFCAFGCDEGSKNGYAMTKSQVLDIALAAAKDKDLGELHIVSGLHPTWSFDYYVDIITAIHQALPLIHLKAFTAVEINHFSKISGKSFSKVLQILKNAGLTSLPGGGAEIFSNRIRKELCPNKASTEDWLNIMHTAHSNGIPSNATMLYGHIETYAERIDHLIALRELQDQTQGFNAFIGLPYHPANTPLAKTHSLKRVPAWEDLKMIAIARLMLDNFKYIKAYWIMLTLPIAQLALAFGANDLDGTVREEKITHAAGATTAKSLDKDTLISVIKQSGRVPVLRDSMYNIIQRY